MEYVFDDAMWTEGRKILTQDTLIVPGLEMFGHNCAAHNLHLLPPHIHKTSEFLYQANGSQKYHVDDKEYILRGNQVLVVDAELLHSSGSRPYGRYEDLWFRLDVPVFARSIGVPQAVQEMICQRLGHVSHPVITLQENLYGDLESAFYELASDDPVRQLGGYARFVNFIIHLIRCSDPAASYSPAIQKIIAHIEENICTHLELGTLAELAGLSLSGFKQKFRRETGITPREYINLLKIEKAKEYLIAGASVTETAFALDFSSSSYFSVLFRQIENMAPREFIRKQKE